MKYSRDRLQTADFFTLSVALAAAGEESPTAAKFLSVVFIDSQKNNHVQDCEIHMRRLRVKTDRCLNMDMIL